MNKNLVYGLTIFAGIILAWLTEIDQQRVDESQKTSSPHSEAPANSIGRIIQVGSLELSVPKGWLQEEPKSSMRSAQFRLPRVSGDHEDAEVVVFNNIGGSVDQNINRWINQFTQAGEKSSEGLESTREFNRNGLEITLVYLDGIYASRGTSMTGPVIEKPGFSLLAAIAITPEGPYYFKAIGPKNTIREWSNSFDTLIESFKY